MSQKDTVSFEGRSYRNDYKYKFKVGQVAKTGGIQTKEFTIASDDPEGLIEAGIKLFVDHYIAYKNKHIKILSPFEDGYEPTS